MERGGRERWSVAGAIHAFAIAVAIVTGRAAGAQTESPAAARDEAPRRVLQEVIVTAQKTEQNVQDVPISMSVLGDEFLREQSVTDFRDVTLYTPNAVIDNSATFPDVRIRGFGSPLSNKAFEQSVSLVIDGVAYGRAPYWQGPLFDLERVEVLRGP
ncbi:MAG: TonB-dependent receptor plug domain-containing protein, partial [Candidatus Binatia bacterium]